MDLTDEERRILIATRDGRLSQNEHGRYVIDGEPRPERKARERVMRMGWVGWRYTHRKTVGRIPVGEYTIYLTAKGESALKGER